VDRQEGLVVVQLEEGAVEGLEEALRAVEELGWYLADRFSSGRHALSVEYLDRAPVRPPVSS
jgi:hypothetical protein